MNRKQIVKALEEHFGVKAKYMGTPSFAYEITIDNNTFIIDRVGEITTAEGHEVKLESLINGDIVMEHENRPIELEVAVPIGEHSGKTLRNLVNMIYSKQPLIKKAFGLEEDIVEDDFSIGVNETEIEILEDFQKALEDIGENSCPGIKFDFSQKTITFKFYKGDVSSEKFQVFTKFVALVNKNAKAKRYASAKVTATDNEKYTFRTWLLRLGMIGPEYKLARKILLEKLSGNGAFRKPDKEAS